jgi:Na+-transporting NADH:ubiquinone oxidoreductase subunit D
LPPSAFFIIGILIWTFRQWKPEQNEQADFKIMDISHGEGGHH